MHIVRTANSKACKSLVHQLLCTTILYHQQKELLSGRLHQSPSHLQTLTNFLYKKLLKHLANSVSLEISMFSWISSSVNLNIPNTHLVWLFLPKKKQQSGSSYQTDGLYNQKLSAESCSTLQALLKYHGTNTNDMSTIKSRLFQRMPHSLSSSLLLVGHLT